MDGKALLGVMCGSEGGDKGDGTAPGEGAGVGGGCEIASSEEVGEVG